MKNEEQIEELRKAHPEAEGQDLDAEKFELAPRTASSLEVLKDTDFEYDEWREGVEDNKWVKRTAKLWFTLHKKYNQQEWT